MQICAQVGFELYSESRSILRHKLSEDLLQVGEKCRIFKGLSNRSDGRFVDNLPDKLKLPSIRH